MLEFLSKYFFVIIMVTIFVGLFIILYSTLKRQLFKSKWINTIKNGDYCSLSSINEQYLDDAKIIDVGRDYVTVELKINKRWVYPPRKKS